jgi:hypothetical protein
MILRQYQIQYHDGLLLASPMQALEDYPPAASVILLGGRRIEVQPADSTAPSFIFDRRDQRRANPLPSH